MRTRRTKSSASSSSSRPPVLPLQMRDAIRRQNTHRRSKLRLPRLVAIFVTLSVLLFCLIHLSHQRTRNTKSPVLASLNRTVLNNDTKPIFAGVSPLQEDIDYEKFTVRINTWKREEHLQLSIQHFATCDSVAQIQVVWCVDQGPPPTWLLELESTFFVVIERHDVNSLNERFLALMQPPTAAVLSVDDDVIRPCIALDAAFAKWRRNPDRQVGFDARSHTVIHTDDHNNNNNNSVRWKYAYMSTTEKSNQYSITLTRFSFLHRDYLTAYWQILPDSIRQTVADNFNCEDIAMSFLISSLTGGKPPLLADFWAVKSQIKLYVGANKISGAKDHKGLRDDCMNDFANQLDLKDRLVPTKLRHHDDDDGSYFEYGAFAENWNPLPAANDENSSSIIVAEKTVKRWKEEGYDVMLQELGKFRMEASKHIFEKGLIEKTEPWKDRFQHHHDTKEE